MKITVGNQIPVAVPSSNRSRKRQICRYYKKGGCNKDSDNCDFAHGLRELRRPVGYKTLPCNYGNDCEYGPKDCNYIHTESQAAWQARRDAEEAERALQRLRKTQLCFYYDHGGCFYEDCNFAHGEAELVRHANYKTKLCEKALSCSHGPKNCTYIHEETEEEWKKWGKLYKDAKTAGEAIGISVVPANTQAIGKNVANPNNYSNFKTELCFYAKKCSKGPLCTYAHGLHELRHKKRMSEPRMRKGATAPAYPSKPQICPYCDKQTAKIIFECLKKRIRRYQCAKCGTFTETLKRSYTKSVPLKVKDLCKPNGPVVKAVVQRATEFQRADLKDGIEKWRAVMQLDNRYLLGRKIHVNNIDDSWKFVTTGWKGIKPHIHAMYQQMLVMLFKNVQNCTLDKNFKEISFLAYAGIFCDLGSCVHQKWEFKLTAARIGHLICISNTTPRAETDEHGIEEEKKVIDEIIDNPLYYGGNKYDKGCSPKDIRLLNLKKYRLVETELRQDGFDPLRLLIIGDVDFYDKEFKQWELKSPKTTKQEFSEKASAHHLWLQTHFKLDLQGGENIAYRYTGENSVAEMEMITVDELLRRGQELEKDRAPAHIPPEEYIPLHDILRARLVSILRVLAEVLEDDLTHAEIEFTETKKDGFKMKVISRGALHPECLVDKFKRKFCLFPSTSSN